MVEMRRGMVVRFTLGSLGLVIHAQIARHSERAGHWYLIGVDGAWYEVGGADLEPLTGKSARRTKRATDTLLRHPRTQRTLQELTAPQTPQYYGRKVTHVPRGYYSGDKGPGGTSRGRLERYHLPLKLAARDVPTAVGLDLDPQMLAYLSWAAGPAIGALRAMRKEDDRLPMVYQLCVNEEMPSHEAAHSITEHLEANGRPGVSPATVRRLRQTAERIMADWQRSARRRKRNVLEGWGDDGRSDMAAKRQL